MCCLRGHLRVALGILPGHPWSLGVLGWPPGPPPEAVQWPVLLVGIRGGSILKSPLECSMSILPIFRIVWPGYLRSYRQRKHSR